MTVSAIAPETLGECCQEVLSWVEYREGGEVIAGKTLKVTQGAETSSGAPSAEEFSDPVRSAVPNTSFRSSCTSTKEGAEWSRSAAPASKASD